MPSVKLLGNILHNGLIHRAGVSIELEAETAKRLVDEGLAEVENAAKRVLHKSTKGSDTSGD